MSNGSSSFEDFDHMIPLGTKPYLFEPEVSSDENRLNLVIKNIHMKWMIKNDKETMISKATVYKEIFALVLFSPLLVCGRI